MAVLPKTTKGRYRAARAAKKLEGIKGCFLQCVKKRMFWLAGVGFPRVGVLGPEITG